VSLNQTITIVLFKSNIHEKIILLLLVGMELFYPHQAEPSSGLSSLGHQVLILLMELPPTLQETSMWQEAPMEDWMVIAVQEAMTSSW